ncbi:anti-sigma factor [Cellulomonas sp. H30R-01]|uniref:anti-sigma factor n=1 Tax=Cellulomonas sp. H30R-01 TaxID=2704467 RepID=UPI00138C6065|nr:anti-sigma factor [Cellulomonas sp. H30R-01]QHT56193.1 anti-sigma factor [Cellulomonas sp. H30R-01]
MRFDDEHVDDDVLTLLALGEDGASDAERAHVDACERCTAEVRTLADVAGLARTAGELVPPAPRVWDAIAADLGLAAGPDAGVASPRPVRAPVPSDDLSRPSPPPAVEQTPTARVPSGPAGGDDQPLADVVPLTRRPSRWRWVAAAAAVGVVAGAGATWWAGREPAPQVVASATLEPLPGWDAGGSAEVETRSDGSRQLVVDLTGQVGGDGFREVWLLKPDVSGLVSLGTLDGPTGRFDLPAGLDLREFSVVDVSEEQFDGDPAHSGDSIVRGPLQA